LGTLGTLGTVTFLAFTGEVLGLGALTVLATAVVSLATVLAGAFFVFAGDLTAGFAGGDTGSTTFFARLLEAAAGLAFSSTGSLTTAAALAAGFFAATFFSGLALGLPSAALVLFFVVFGLVVTSLTGSASSTAAYIVEVNTHFVT